MPAFGGKRTSGYWQLWVECGHMFRGYRSGLSVILNSHPPYVGSQTIN